MKARTVQLAVAAFMLISLSALSCHKDKQICTDCKAVCTGAAVANMNYCGDENSVNMQESSFRASHQGCEVTCTRKTQSSGY